MVLSKQSWIFDRNEETISRRDSNEDDPKKESPNEAADEVDEVLL